MQVKTVTRFLSSIGKAPNAWLQIPNLQSINLFSDGNQCYSYFSDRVYFDTIREIVKLKSYDYFLVGCKLNAYMISGNVLTLKRNPVNGSCLALPNINALRLDTNSKIRELAIGDKIFKVDSSTGKKISGSDVEVIDIKSDGDDKYSITLSKALAVAGDTVAFLRGDITEPTTLCEFDETLSILYRPISTYTSDIYIDFAQVASFTMI